MGGNGLGRSPSIVDSAAGAAGALGLAGAADALGTLKRGAGGRSLPPLQQLAYEADQFGGLEGLGKEGVDADVEAVLDLVLTAGAHDGEGKVTGPRIGAEPGGGTQSVEPGHDHVEGDDIGADLVDDVQTLDAVGRGHDLETLQLEIDPDQLPDDLVVVHNKHPTRRAWHNLRVGRHVGPRPAFPHFHPARAIPNPPVTHPPPKIGTPPDTPSPTPKTRS